VAATITLFVVDFKSVVGVFDTIVEGLDLVIGPIKDALK